MQRSPTAGKASKVWKKTVRAHQVLRDNQREFVELESRQIYQELVYCKHHIQARTRSVNHSDHGGRSGVKYCCGRKKLMLVLDGQTQCAMEAIGMTG